MTSTPYHRTRRAARAAVLGSAVLLAALTALPAAAAGGDPAPAADGVADVAGARQVLQSGQVRDTVGRFLVATRQPGSAAAPGLAAAADGGTVGARGSAPAAPAAPPAFDLKDPVPLYELSPDFVAGTVRPAAATVARVAYLASRVTAADGHRAAVLLAPGAPPPGSPSRRPPAVPRPRPRWDSRAGSWPASGTATPTCPSPSRAPRSPAPSPNRRSTPGTG
ncbi:hypothetical protein GCM10025734_24040 [Kitasatospora paranensis]|uniref:hypothetical protein n=1 Tax=Kitasatospora paranensis TaxID=258053 RepID=UPI0031E5D236